MDKHSDDLRSEATKEGFEETDVDTGTAKRVHTPINKQEISNEPTNKPGEKKSPTKVINVKKTIGSDYGGAGQSDSSPSTSPPRKKLISALREKLADEKKAIRIKIAHEIAMDSNFELPDSSVDTAVPLTHDKSPEAEKMRMEKAVKEVVQKAFWDCVRANIESNPPRYEHAFILLQEIKDVLLSLLPPNRVTSLHKKIEECMDMELYQQQAENDTLDVKSIASFVIDMMTLTCAPFRDEQVASLRSIEDIVDMFKGIHKVLDIMKIDVANFAIKIVRPHIRQQKFEYERSQFAQLVQKSSDGLKMTKEWLILTYKYIADDLDKIKESLASNGEDVRKFEERKKVALYPVSVLRTAYTRILSPNFDMADLPETLRMDHERLETLRKQVEQLVLVSSVMLTSCGVYGQPLASHQAFLNKLKNVLMTITEPESNTDKSKTDLLERISIQCCKEAEEYVREKGREVERCVSQEKNIFLKTKITALETPHTHPVYSVLYKRTIQYLRVNSEIIAKHSSTTPPNIPAPPAGLSFVASELVGVSWQYAKLVNLNKTVYGPFYVPILREILGIPKSNNNSPAVESKNFPDQKNGEAGAKKKLNMEAGLTKTDKMTESDAKDKPTTTGKYKVTGSIDDLD